MTASPRSEVRGPKYKGRRAPQKETVKVGQESKGVRAATLASLLVVMVCGIFLTRCTVVRNGSDSRLAGHHPFARHRVGSGGSAAAIYRHRGQLRPAPPLPGL